MSGDGNRLALVLAGGIALGSYQAGVAEALAGRHLGWVAGSSVGAVNAVLLAGSAPGERLAVLQRYWLDGATGFLPAVPAPTSGRHVANWLSVAQARLLGSPRHLVAAGPQLAFDRFYDLSPTASFLRQRIDFGRLNGGEVRVTIAATDLESGDLVTFDTGRGDRLEIDHVLASCGFLPEFAPVEIGGRLLGDGGLYANAPVEPVLDSAEGSGGTVLVVDLFARDGRRPSGLESALARKNALLFGNQTWARLALYQRLWERLLPADAARPRVLYLSYQPVPGEAGPEMPFDFSRATAHERWQAGLLDGEAALDLLDRGGETAMLTAVRRRDPARPSDARSEPRA